MLIKPPFAFAHCTDNITGTPSATPGTSFTAGANNADGTAVSVLSALAHDVHRLVIGVAGIFSAGVASNALMDLLVDPAGGTSWASLIDDLLIGWARQPVTGEGTFHHWYEFPLWIPAGASLGVRARTSHTANLTLGRVGVWAFGEPSRPDMWWCGQRVESLGIDAANSKGTDITPGNTGTYGAWTSVGGTIAGRYGSIQLGINGSDATADALAYHWQLGYGSVQLPGSPTLHSNHDTNERVARAGQVAVPCDIAEGTQMQVRGTCSGTAEIINVALYGVH